MSKAKMMPVYIMALLAVAFWGGSFAGAKVALAEASPMMVLFLRSVVSLAVLVPIARRFGELSLPTKRQALTLAFMGFMGFYFHLGIQTVAMRTAGSATANLQMAAAPALTALMAAFFLKEKLTKDGILGIVLAFLGVALVIGLGTRGAHGFSACRVGDFLITVSAFNWAAFMVITRWLFRDGAYPPVFTILWEILFTIIMCSATLLFEGEDFSAVLRFSAPTWIAVCSLGLFCSGLAYVFWYYAASKLPVAKLMVFQFFQPLVGVVLGYVLIGERFTPLLFIGGAMIISGVWAVNRKRA